MSTRTGLIVLGGLTAPVIVATAYVIGISATGSPWGSALACAGFVAVMWSEAWRRRDSTEVSVALAVAAAGAAAVFLLLAIEFARMAEVIDGCSR